MKVLIGNAWPYSSGSLHLGRLAAWIPGDILARYHREKGDEVIFISGSDCHGTPILMKAKEEKKSPREVSDYYHNEFKRYFEKADMSFDIYAKTDSPYHHKIVRELVTELYKNGYIYEKILEQNYCEECGEYLSDKMIEGTCPYCGGAARGDQCEECSALLDPEDLIDKKCKVCHSEPVIKQTKHLFFKLSSFDNDIKALVERDSRYWRNDSIKITKRYIKEGLRDRAITRTLDWGVDVPFPGFEDKKIYVWIDAIMGYISASRKVAEERNEDYKEYWNDENSRIYFVHGKDNIPFHTVILPAILYGLNIGKSEIRMVSSQYINLEGKKFSAAKNWAVWVPYIFDHYDSDSIRYYLTIHGAEKRDSDFTWRKFINSHNGDLLGCYGNFINRSLSFIHKNFDGKLDNCGLNEEIQRKLKNLYIIAGNKIENGEFKAALEKIFDFIKESNKYFDNEKPWVTLKEDKERCRNTLYNCVQIIANLSNLLEPFVPESAAKIRQFLNIEKPIWSFVELKDVSVNELSFLFTRIDKSKIDEEIQLMIDARNAE